MVALERRIRWCGAPPDPCGRAPSVVLTDDGAPGSSVNLLSGPCVNPAGEMLVEETRYRCPCCGYKTLGSAGAMALCAVCWWEDDGQEDEDAAEVRLTVNGQISLSEAREHYTRCGASHPRFLPYVREPQAAEQ